MWRVFPHCHRRTNKTVSALGKAATIKKSRSDWLKAPSAPGKPRKDSQIRNFADKANDYLERWDLLGLDASCS